MAKFGMVGKFLCEASNRDNLVSILSEASALMSKQPDCKFYIISTDANDETAIWVMELWDSKEAHDQSLTLPEVRTLIEKAMPMITGTDGASLNPISGKGL